VFETVLDAVDVCELVTVTVPVLDNVSLAEVLKLLVSEDIGDVVSVLLKVEVGVAVPVEDMDELALLESEVDADSDTLEDSVALFVRVADVDRVLIAVCESVVLWVDVCDMVNDLLSELVPEVEALKDGDVAIDVDAVLDIVRDTDVLTDLLRDEETVLVSVELPEVLSVLDKDTLADVVAESDPVVVSVVEGDVFSHEKVPSRRLFTT
jgi:hypothetical protein